MSYTYSDWNNKQGTIPVKWSPDHYESLPWYEHPDKRQGFTTPKDNYDIYGDRIGCLIPKFEEVGKGVFIPEDVDKIFGNVLAQFDLRDSVYAFAKYTPGLILPWHRDNYPTYARNKKAEVKDIVRIMVFLHDPAPGHQLWIEDRYCTGPAGSWYSWQGATKHMAANLGETDRYVIQITGKINR
jgi:hypothetical protein|tara:strand:+ start:3132 stop:3683 length:552 start_codon:yes stop_codon:yes gene_type:complete